MSKTVRIIGIDPGLRQTGWGIIEYDGVKLSFVQSGTVKSDAALDLALRLNQIYDGLSGVIDHHAPEEAAVEQTFVNKDARATLKLGQARGIALVVPAIAGLGVFEYAPNQVKKTVIGVGHGDKNQIKSMLKFLLPLARYDSDDAADALAIAICHAHHRKIDRIRSLTESQLQKPGSKALA
ncbi:MAG: crossover junction endodeoxyribonuclease RuvC [Methyloligellaceae bacterium]